MTSDFLVLAASDAFEQGLWEGVFQLAALAIVAFWVNFVYQRWRRRADARQELVDEIDAFTLALYGPRKMYQLLVDPAADALKRIPDATLRETRRAEMVHACLRELIDAIGRFRALQVKLVPLFGWSEELFGHYMAIWRYLKELRTRMQTGESLFFHHESAESADAFFRLIDSFRYRVLIAATIPSAPSRLRPEHTVVNRMRECGNKVYDEFFTKAATN